MEQTTKGERTRHRIIAEAAAVFNQRGYEGTSIHDLMTATGLEKGGIYRHFESKDELAAEAYRYAWHEATHARTRDIDSIEGAMPKLRYLVDRFVTLRSPIPGGCPLMNTAVEAEDGSPLMRSLALEFLRDWQHRIQTIVCEGIRTGEIASSTNARCTANRLIAMLEGALMIARLERTREALEDARHMLDKELDRISATGSPKRARHTTARA